jgi:flagellar hook-length control protein FliK
VPAIDLRFEPVASPTAATPAVAGPLPAPPTTMPAATPLTAGDALRAIELPASARLEQALATLDPETRNLQSIVRTVRLFTAGDGLSEARLQLEPDHLGPVDLTVRVEHGSVSAHFRAETSAAQRWIETHQHELRAGLREQGLEVKDVVVTTDPDGRRDRRQDAAPPKPARGRRGAAVDADAPRFEVRV